MKCSKMNKTAQLRFLSAKLIELNALASQWPQYDPIRYDFIHEIVK